MRRLLSILVFLVGASASAQDVEFTLKATPSVGSIDDPFTVVVQTVVHGVDAPDRYFPPDFGKDFVVLDQRQQQSTQWSIDPTRGQQIMNVELRRYTVKAQRTGKLRIGEAKIRMGGQEIQTKPVVVEVLPAGKMPPPAAPADPNAPQGNAAPGFTPPMPGGNRATFIHVVADRPKVYLGEQVTVTWLLYTRADVLKFEPKPPKLEGFWVETLYEPQSYFNYHSENVDGRDYSVAVIAKRALFPTRAGKLVIPKYEADVATTYTAFSGPQHLEGPELTVESVALPPGAPPGFDPAYVGNFSVEASVDRDHVAAGESLTLALKVSGAGAIRRAGVPALSLDGFEVTPRKDFGQRVDSSADLLRGERRYTYLLTPLRAGKIAVPPISIPFFDPGSGKYETARTEPIPIMVIGEPSQIAGKGGQAGDNVIGREIRPLREEATVASRMVARFYHSRLFVGALGLPLTAWVMVILFDRVRQRLRRETPRARLRRARGRARKRLRLAELHIRGNRAGKFFGEVARVLQEHIEERVGEPVAALTRDQLRELLTRRGFPEETVDALVRELENCDFARFAPSASGPGEMRAALRRVRALLGAIERVRPPEAVAA